MNSSQHDRDTSIHDNLAQWIVQSGGDIHESLALCVPSTVHDNNGSDQPSISTSSSKTSQDYSHRGIFAKHSSIKKGEVLIRLPEKLALDGKDFPEKYGNDKTASPWLRCLSSLLQAWYAKDISSDIDGNNDGTKFYLESLPETYDSLLNWKSWELHSFLSGTSLGTFALSGIANKNDSSYDADKEDSELEGNMHERYQSTVLPYLKHLNQRRYFQGSKKTEISPQAKRQRIGSNKDDEKLEYLYNYFTRGCMCISTRAFHMQTTTAFEKTSYQGPYLLPYIDLLNHAPHSSSKHVTTLERDPNDGSFVMVAKRDIEQGEEICHSYDSASDGKVEESEHSTSLTSAQLLQTFGFVDLDHAMESLLTFFCKNKSSQEWQSKSYPLNLTPAILHKNDICHICREVSESSYPSLLCQTMEESGLIDEGWEYWKLPSLKDEKSSGSSRQSSLDVLTDELVIGLKTALSDELITICSLNFLPDDAVDELCHSSQDKNLEHNSLLLSEEVLDDYFLGKLVLSSIIKMVDRKIKQYEVCFDGELVCEGSTDRSQFLQIMRSTYKSTNNSAFCWGKTELQDLDALSKLYTNNNSCLTATQNELVKKFVCGMIISLEERACLLHLKKIALDKLLQLDES